MLSLVVDGEDSDETEALRMYKTVEEAQTDAERHDVEHHRQKDEEGDEDEADTGDAP